MSTRQDDCLNSDYLNVDYLNEFFFRIKASRHSLTNSILNNELTKFSNDSDYTNYHIIHKNYNEFGLSTLASDNLSHTLKYTDKFVENLANNCKFIVLDQKSLKVIDNHLNKLHINQNAIDLLKTINKWQQVEVTKYHTNTKHVSMFNYNNKWFIAHSKNLIHIDEKNIQEICNYSTIINMTNTENIENIEHNQKNITKIFLSYLKDKHIITENNCIDKNVNKNFVYHFLIKNSEFKKIPSHNNKNNYGISISWITDLNCNVLRQDDLSNNFICTKIQYEKKLYFSCLDELLTSIDTMNNDDMMSKNIQYAGYHIKIFNTTYTSFKSCFISTEIYNYITCLLPQHKNQYRNYLELYQYDKLTEILPYLHKYPADVVRRINMSVKTLSKEILNIYHSTRNKQNCDLYKVLPIRYRKVLYNLHKIYVNQKYGEFIIKSNDTMKEKKSISVDIVYGYVKGLKNFELIDLFQNRTVLIKELQNIDFDYSEIMYTDNIDIITQSELMFQN